MVHIDVETLVVLIMQRRTSLYPGVGILSHLDLVVMKRKLTQWW